MHVLGDRGISSAFLRTCSILKQTGWQMLLDPISQALACSTDIRGRTVTRHLINKTRQLLADASKTSLARPEKALVDMKTILRFTVGKPETIACG